MAHHYFLPWNHRETTNSKHGNICCSGHLWMECWPPHAHVVMIACWWQKTPRRKLADPKVWNMLLKFWVDQIAIVIVKSSIQCFTRNRWLFSPGSSKWWLWCWRSMRCSRWGIMYFLVATWVADWECIKSISKFSVRICYIINHKDL